MKGKKLSLLDCATRVKFWRTRDIQTSIWDARTPGQVAACSKLCHYKMLCHTYIIYRGGCVRRPGSIQPAAKHRLARDAYYSLIDVAMQPTVQSESVIIEITTCSDLSLLLYIIPAPIYIIIATTTERRWWVGRAARYSVLFCVFWRSQNDWKSLAPPAAV
jgi:hypothetical protein